MEGGIITTVVARTVNISPYLFEIDARSRYNFIQAQNYVAHSSL